MGGGDSHEVQHHYHTTTVYQTPPAVQKQLDEAIAEVKELKAEAVAAGDPALFRENATKALEVFIRKIPELGLKDYIEKLAGEFHIGFLGNTSAGKSSIINTLYGTSEPVALDDCTKGCHIVHSYLKDGRTTFVWDVAGSNDDYQYYNATHLAFVKSLDLVVIVYDNDIGMISNFVKVVHAVNTNIIFVRTKCDMKSKYDIRTVDQVKALDVSKLESLHADPIVYAVSAHNIDNGAEETFDWFPLKEALKC